MSRRALSRRIAGPAAEQPRRAQVHFAVAAPQTLCMALLLRLGARLGVTRPRLSFPCDPANVARGGGVTPEGGPPPQRARVIGASTRREMAGDAGGRTPKPQETGNV